jgi:hypothetical protein
MKTLSFIATMLFGVCISADAASVVVNWSTDREFVTRGYSSYLSAGTPVDGDGALLQLGYFSLATPASPFAGTWTVLAVGSVGDQGDLDDGFFSITSVLDESAIVAPALGAPLGVRFFDGPSIAASSYYNTAVNVDGTGLWLDPGDPAPVIELMLSKISSDFENRPGVWQAYIPVPEPSAACLWSAALGSLLLLGRKRRRGKPVPPRDAGR